MKFKPMFVDLLASMGACREALDWVDTQSFDTAWKFCHRPDWMRWLVLKMSFGGYLSEKKASDVTDAVLKTRTRYEFDMINGKISTDLYLGLMCDAIRDAVSISTMSRGLALMRGYMQEYGRWL